MRTPAIAATATVLALAAPCAGATALYKLTDPLGKITYADVVPRGFEGDVKRIEIDANAHAVAPARIPEILAQPAGDPLLAERRHDRALRDERLRAAEARAAAARAALQDARSNSIAEDWYYFQRPNPYTGARRAPRPEYLARLEQLERDVAAAQESLDAVRREAR